MLNQTKRMYMAFKTKDSRYDGKFFVGIKSTKIYCRPICRAKIPKKENCVFFYTASEAELNGFRPCLLCRPELSPGNSKMDSATNLAYAAANILEKNCSNDLNIEEIAGLLGCSSRHLRRVFFTEYNVPLVKYLQTCRLLLAKRLLKDTNIPITDVAMAAGFGSLRRFNDLFKNKYGITPSSIRKSTKLNLNNNDITIRLDYRPPYLWENMLSFFKRRAIDGIELVANNEYMRTVHFNRGNENIYGWLKVSHYEKNKFLKLTVSESLLSVLPLVISKVNHMFDLYCDPDIVYEALESMDMIKPNCRKLGIRIPGCFDPFEMSVRAILGQQITVKAASTLVSRIVNKYGITIDTGIDGLTHVFPQIDTFLSFASEIEEKLGLLGVLSARSRTIYSLAESLKNNIINFDICINPELEIRKMLKIKGVGVWTARYIAMRAMGYTDAFLETDVAIKKALLPYDVKEILKFFENLKPWRSYATICLWNSL